MLLKYNRECKYNDRSIKTKLDLTYKKHLKNSELLNGENSKEKIFKILIAEE